ncbi:MFS transporter [Oceanicola sp. 22II-s10i]|uniref:MFS transporter n=1 Tax=Oceanicola sp. 22II-s10i TaxID=1317116 RepID=UPI000B520155|nr:MFS transporter [Oceanicola sp. 22II-s10i]OWU85566.1 MFS transporter [Oceanicola sp. 22II-s10i]
MSDQAFAPAPVTTAAPVPPGLVILALALGAFAIGTTEFASMALLPFFATDLAVSEARAADAISAYAIGVVIGAPTISVLCARVSRRLMLVLLMLTFAVFNTASGLAQDFGLFTLTRFLSGLPHGAYLGLAALTAAAVVPRNRRASAVARVFVGLSLATTIGVPAASWLGQVVGWRWGFALVGVLSLATALSVWFAAPRDRPDPAANPLRELGALRNRQVLLLLATGAIGFGGFFAVYTYLASTVIHTTGAPASAVPVVLMITGAGMTVFTLLSGMMADRNANATVYACFTAGTLVLLLYSVAAGSLWTLIPVVFSLGMLGGVATVIQSRLMDVAGEAQQLAAAMHHAAFNFANALGPMLAAAALRMGYDYPASGVVGAVLAVAGIGLYTLALVDARRR